MNQRRRWSSPKSWRHSYCLSSSRLKMTTRLGSWLRRSSKMKALPNEPVPPVTRIDEPCRMEDRSGMGAMMAEPWNDPERVSSSSSRPGWARPGCPERCSRTSAGCRCSSGSLRGCRAASLVDEVVVATSTDSRDDVVEQAARRLGVAVVRGSEDDVLDPVPAGPRRAPGGRRGAHHGRLPVRRPRPRRRRRGGLARGRGARLRVHRAGPHPAARPRRRARRRPRRCAGSAPPRATTTGCT